MFRNFYGLLKSKERPLLDVLMLAGAKGFETSKRGLRIWA